MAKNILLAFLLFLSCAIYAQQEPDNSNVADVANRQERIINFHSDIVIDTTGKVQVTEHITVYANGDQIKRGIVRRIPVYRKDKEGAEKKVDIRILFVTCNGQKANFKVESADRKKEIYIGDGNTYLDPGVYEYIITYETYGQVGFFDTFDELYWNVTGNEWDFNIEKASATVILPEELSSLTTDCYTGSYGSNASDCSEEKAGNEITFTSNTSLGSYEGLTVVVSFPRDIIKRPPPPSKMEALWDKYKLTIWAILGPLLLIIFCFFTWEKVGKDPEKPVVIPQFKPPHDWSAAITRYLYKKNYDSKAFTVALVSMAVKRVIKISNEKGEYTLTVTGEKDKLSNEETEVYNALFTGRDTITVSSKKYTTFGSANTRLKAAIESKWSISDYLHKNIKYIVFAGLLVIGILILNAVFSNLVPMIAGVGIAAPFVIFGLFAIISGMKQRSNGGCQRIGMIIFGLFFCIPALGPIAVVFFQSNLTIGISTLVSLIIFGVYIYLIKAPTQLGIQTEAELDGFKMYLKTAEENRLNILTPPEKTPELFEKLLPYAIALDVENEWGKKFDSIFKQTDYNPDWYVSTIPFSPYSFTSSLGHSFSSSLSSAQVDPTPSSSSSSSSGGSWSSGSSGGGFSGGGGGGGGGGGW